MILNKLAGISSLENKILMLGTLQLCLAAGDNQAATVLTETVLQLMEKLLVEAAASHQSVDQYQVFAGSALLRTSPAFLIMLCISSLAQTFTTI